MRQYSWNIKFVVDTVERLARVMDETLHQIQQAATQRHMLFRLAGKQHLTPEQQQRMQDIGNRLPVLWDQYRRELASSQRRDIPMRERHIA